VSVRFSVRVRSTVRVSVKDKVKDRVEVKDRKRVQILTSSNPDPNLHQYQVYKGHERWISDKNCYRNPNPYHSPSL
jgi:hypothetical protein